MPEVAAHRFSIAPMMDLTDRHARFMLRLISRHALLYTEMVTAEALLHGKREKLLAYNPEEHPVALQVGGSDPAKLAECARMAADVGYDEINLNVGCPSDRVQSGAFGACLMQKPELVARCYDAMAVAAPIPVTIKCRIGVDDQDPQQALPHFVRTVAGAGCQHFSVHARKAWLQGLSPRQNRDVPPLDYALVYRLKEAEPGLNIVLNGGIETLEAVTEHLNHVDGVMLGRKAYYEPWLLRDVDQKVFGSNELPTTRAQVFTDYVAYCERQLAAGCALKNLSKHLLGLFHGVPGARRFRRHISENAHLSGADTRVLQIAYDSMLEVCGAIRD